MGSKKSSPVSSLRTATPWTWGPGMRIQLSQQVPSEPPLRLLPVEYELMEREWCEIQRLMGSR